MSEPGPRTALEPAALAAIRTELRLARGMARLDVLLDQRDPAAVVRALPADDLYFTIREIGLSDAVQLVELASSEQFRTFLDLECWSGDRVAPRRALPWIRAARSGSLQDPRMEARWRAKLEALDHELLALVLLDTLRVHDLDQDPDPYLESDRFLRTPEGRYELEFLVDGAEYAAVRGLIDDLYAEDPFQATRLVASIRWELPSELEETELRWRTGRLADLGFPPRAEALSWYARPQPPRSPPSATPPRSPGFWLDRLGTGSLLARAAARLAPGQREDLELQLVTAANAVMGADAVDPTDLEGVRRSVETARALVEVGLEGEARGDEGRAAEVLADTSAKTLFQRGFGQILELRSRAVRLLRTVPGAPLLDPPLGEALAALMLRRPAYHPGLEAPREEWGTLAAGAFEPRPFRSVREIARAAEALALAAGLLELAQRLGIASGGRGRRLRPTVTALYLTALANERLGGPFSPQPFSPRDLPAASRVLERIDDPRLAAEGGPGELLAGMARARAEELAPLREGAAPHPELVSALLVGR